MAHAKPQVSVGTADRRPQANFLVSNRVKYRRGSESLCTFLRHKGPPATICSRCANVRPTGGTLKTSSCSLCGFLCGFPRIACYASQRVRASHVVIQIAASSSCVRSSTPRNTHRLFHIVCVVRHRDFIRALTVWLEFHVAAVFTSTIDCNQTHCRSLPAYSTMCLPLSARKKGLRF